MAPAQGKPSTVTVTVGRDTGAPGISDILLASGSSTAAKFCSQPSPPQSRHDAGVRLHFLSLSPSSPRNRILGSFVTKLFHKLSPPSKKGELGASSQDSFLRDTLPSGMMGGGVSGAQTSSEASVTAFLEGTVLGDFGLG